MMDEACGVDMAEQGCYISVSKTSFKHQENSEIYFELWDQCLIRENNPD